MQSKEVALRYARALFESSEATASGDQVFAEMRELAKVFQDPTVKSFVRSKIVSTTNKRQVIEAVFGSRKISDSVKNLLYVLADKSRLEIFSEVVDGFESLKDEKNGVHRGTVRSATVLQPEERKAIETKVSQVTGRKVILNYKEEPKMIGGLTAEVGGYLFDDSIKSHIRRLKEDLNRRVN